MNERIKELWDRAANHTDNSWEEQTRFMERFAKLVAEECAEVVATMDGGENMFSRGIRAHFGIE